MPLFPRNPQLAPALCVEAASEMFINPQPLPAAPKRRTA